MKLLKKDFENFANDLLDEDKKEDFSIGFEIFKQLKDKGEQELAKELDKAKTYNSAKYSLLARIEDKLFE